MYGWVDGSMDGRDSGSIRFPFCERCLRYTRTLFGALLLLSESSSSSGCQEDAFTSPQCTESRAPARSKEAI